MISLSQLDHFGNLQNCFDQSTSTICCTVCEDVLPSVLSYHNHNVNKHTCHELSLAIIKLFGLQLGQKCELKEQIADSIFECDSLYYKSNHNTKKELNLAEQKYFSGEEICQGPELEDKRITNIIRNEDENVGNDFYEYKKVPSKEIKLDEDMLRRNKGLNICDYLVAEEVFLQPHDYTEETVSVDSVTKEDAVTEPEDSLHSLIHDDNYSQVNSNNPFSEYDHPQMKHQSGNESENDYEFLPISGTEMEGNDDICILPHSPVSEVFPTTDSISLASLIFLILQNSAEGLPVSIIDTLLQSLFPYFFKNLSYSYVKCDMLDLIQKTLRKERGFRKTRVKRKTYNEPLWETTSSISKYEEEIQNSSNLDSFTESPALLNALKRREVKIDINNHGVPIISYSEHQKCSFQEGSVEENDSFKQGNNVYSERNFRYLHNQDSFDINSHSRFNKQENMCINNNNELLFDFNHVHQDLNGMMQNEFAKTFTGNTQTSDVCSPKRKKIKNENESQHGLIMQESCVLNLDNSNEWAEIRNMHVKSEPLLWERREQELDKKCQSSNQMDQASDQRCQKGDNCHKNFSCEEDINNYIYNGEKMYDIDSETLNVSAGSKQNTFENETNLVLDNNKELEGSEKILLEQNIYEQNYSSESLQQLIQQRIPCNVLYEQNNIPREEKLLQEETSHQEQEPTLQPKQRRIPCKEKDMNKLKMSHNKGTNNRNPTKKRQLRRKQSSSKSDGLIRDLNTHRISEKMRRKELNEQFDNLTKRLPRFSLGKSLSKIEILNNSRKCISKLKNTNAKLLIEKEKLEDYQQTLISRLHKLK